MRTNVWLVLLLSSCARGTGSWAAEEEVRPQGYRHVDLRKPYDLHFVDGDIRRTWSHGSRATAVHVFTKLCPDPLVGSWGTYEPVFFRFRPGATVEDVRRPGYTETSGATHQVGALTYRTVRPKNSPLEVKQTWYIAGRWCLASAVDVRNLTDETDEAAAISVGLNLRPPVNLNRGQLDWHADFHSNGKAGVPMVPRLVANESRAVKYAVAFGKTADEAVAHARQGLGASGAEAVQKTDASWSRRLPVFATGNAGLNAHLRYAAITQDVNWEPDGRAPGDLGGWGRAERAEVCGCKNYYDQDDMIVPILDMPVYD